MENLNWLIPLSLRRDRLLSAQACELLGMVGVGCASRAGVTRETFRRVPGLG